MPTKAQIQLADAQKKLGIKVKEEDVQQGIIEALEALGYLVLVTSAHFTQPRCRTCRIPLLVPTCSGCGKRGWGTAGRLGNTPGIPDLLVTRASWPAVFAGLEVKGPDTAVSKAQAKLNKAGYILIVRDIDAAIAAVKSVEEELHRWPK